MKIATLGISHEANTFSTSLADLEEWQWAGILLGPEIVEQYGDAEATISGFLELGHNELTIDVVPLLFSRVTPMGPITADAFEYLLGQMLDLLRDHGPWDGVLLALHGAAVSTEHPDADGEIIRRVRELVGPQCLIGVTLDMHANVSDPMHQGVDVMTVYQTNPHIDAREQAKRAGILMVQTHRNEVRPTSAFEMIPIAINILRQGTSDFPMSKILAAARAEEQRPGVLSVSVVEGYPYADVHEMGMSVVAITDNDDLLARQITSKLTNLIWDLREHCEGFGVPIEEAVQHAADAKRGPVVLLDTGDNVGAGSPGDSTHILSAAQRIGVRDMFCSISDPGAVQTCMSAGVGSIVEVHVGGKTDDLHGTPVRVRGQVRLLSDGQWEDTESTHGGFRFFDTGPTALLRTDDDHNLLLASRPHGNVSLQQLRAVGLDPMRQRAIVAKGANSPRAAFEPIAAEMIYVASPGVTSADLSTFTYRHRRQPMFPFET
ncbi:M81 family metallopeptidase [Nesterenkonia sphaerica]|uniref:M81 family metallopeptidase n=1 Tax=Nesterenkonia sphaerica TaxID=1804988 RepID=A0A5R9APD3_9MICC|nr:M81 family metallopeptidase [Nesterenkonia sphaerica]TLP79874.1 M81 family metallopeptidase [Nesterenkonia sphaerica]